MTRRHECALFFLDATRSAHREAVAHCEQALNALPHLPETRDRRDQALVLADELGRHLFQAHYQMGLDTLYAQGEQREQAQAELSTASRSTIPSVPWR